MKHLLLLLVIIFIGCKEKNTSIEMDKINERAIIVQSGVPFGKIVANISNFVFAKNNSGQDTIRVLMLVCDTVSKVMLYNKWVAQWQFGYEVVEPINNMLWYPNYNVQYTTSGFPYIIKEYLDENKKPLSKSIVVWQIKEIK